MSRTTITTKPLQTREELLAEYKRHLEHLKDDVDSAILDLSQGRRPNRFDGNMRLCARLVEDLETRLDVRTVADRLK